MILNLHMKYKIKYRKQILIIIFTGLLCTGCKKESPSFLFWCVRPEVITKEIYFDGSYNSEQKNKFSNFLEEDFKKIEGFISSRWNYANDSVKISYKCSQSRLMNYEHIFHKHNIKIVYRD